MSQVLKRCVRCGREIGDASDSDLPTCETCREELRAPVPHDEPTRACPVDGSTMKKEIVHMVAIDRCPACHGVWLDGGELELISRAASGGAAQVFATSLVLGIAI